MPATNNSRSARHALSPALLAATTMFAAFAGILAPVGCTPGGGDIEGMFDCNPDDPCCVGGKCSDGDCYTGGAPGKCTFNGAILAGASCGCAVGGGFDSPGETEPETLSAGPSLRDFAADLESSDFPPGGGPQAAEFFQTGCNNGLAPACVGLAIVHAIAPNPDLPAAALAAEQACELGSHEGCYMLGGAYATGSGVPQDQGMADLMFAQSCEMGLQLGCEGAESIPEAMAIIEARLEQPG